VLELLLIVALDGTAPYAEGPKPPPSLELLEFLGEFGDDEDGLFDDEPVQPREPAAGPPAQKPAPGKPVDRASPTTPKVQP
jgi:hypothetical protein